MKKIPITLIASLGFVSTVVSAQTVSSSEEETSGASAASGNMQSESGTGQEADLSPTAQLQPQTQNGVTYLCGGVGQEEVSYMKKQAKNYDMMLTFAARNGDYLANVDVDIRNNKGDTVLQTTCDAPILLVEVPTSGNYQVRADAEGYKQNSTVRVSAGKGQRVASTVLSWPQQVASTPTETTSGASGSSDMEEERSMERGTGDSGAEDDSENY
ncbi:MAG TPA: hypothetical protein VM571_05365 [Noviherbaspirillum sp.]|nr:hypothetical protein [Noviherbaspirillum sp.]